MRLRKAVNITNTRRSSRVARRTISREYFPGMPALEVVPVEEAIPLVFQSLEYRIERAKGKVAGIFSRIAAVRLDRSSGGESRRAPARGDRTRRAYRKCYAGGFSPSVR